MSRTLKYDSSLSGNYYQKVDGEVYEYRSDGKYASAYAATGGMVQVQLTGYYDQRTTSNMYQTTNGGYIELNSGWQYVAHAPIKYYKAKDVQYYVDRIIRANQKILKNNLFCATYASKLTEDQQWDLYFLQSRLSERNQQLISDGYCTNQKTASPPGYSDLGNNLTGFLAAMEGGAPITGIGEPITISTTAIVVAAIVIASLASAAYFAYKYMAEQAEQDVKFSDELTRTLVAKLTPEEFEQLKQETNGIVTKQKILSSIGGGFAALKWILIAGAGIGAYYLINKKKGKKL